MNGIVSRIKNTTTKQRIIAVSALVLIAGGTSAVIIVSQRQNAVPKRNGMDDLVLDTSALEENDTISAGGTISSAQLYDYIGLESTSIKLEIEDVYVESGDTITAGTQLYKLTAESVADAETKLDKELQSAENALLNQKLSYEETKNDAYSLYQSELLLGETAKNDYNAGISQLDSNLQTALDEYNEALDTVNNTPNEIASRKSEIETLNTEISGYETELSELESEAVTKKNSYTDALDDYNATVSEYNAIAGTVRYIGNYLGLDVSDVELAQIAVSEDTSDSGVTDTPSEMPSDGEKPDFSGMGGMQIGPASNQTYTGTTTQTTDTSETDKFSDMTETESPTQSPTEEPKENPLYSLYESARAEYEGQKGRLSEAESVYLTAKNEYDSANTAVRECNSNISRRKSSVSTLESEISRAENSYSEAKSSITSLKDEYTSLKLSYETDKLALQNTYDTAMASFENAQYHYDITMATIEEELAAAEDAVAVCQENIAVFDETLADGLIDAQQDGVVYSVTYEAEDIISISSALIYYVDDTSFGTTVELDQYDVTKIGIGDSVIIYSSETGMTNGKITSISAGEAETLASVTFNITIAAVGESVNLYSGQSVNVYFNAMSMDTSQFSDAESSGNGEENGKGSFIGGMPDFDPENMPDMNFEGGTPPQRGN